MFPSILILEFQVEENPLQHVGFQKRRQLLRDKVCKKFAHPTVLLTEGKNNKDKFPLRQGFKGMNSQLILKGFSPLKLAQVG